MTTPLTLNIDYRDGGAVAAVIQDFHVEAACAPCDRLPDASEAEDAKRFERVFGAPAHPCSAVLHRIGARWTVFVINALDPGPMRFTALKAHIRGITSKALAETLRAMEYDGLVSRTEFPVNPPHVEYALTEKGRALDLATQAVAEWAQTWLPVPEPARVPAAVAAP